MNVASSGTKKYRKPMRKTIHHQARVSLIAATAPRAAGATGRARIETPMITTMPIAMA